MPNIVMDSYATGNENFQNKLQSAGILEVGQAFTGNGQNITSAQFYIRKLGSPTGNATAKIYPHTGEFGAGGKPALNTSLATSTTSFDVSTLTGSFQLIEFLFNPEIQTVNGQKYIIVLAYSGGDASNAVEYAFDDSAPTHGGNISELQAGTWTGFASTDLIFYVYCDPDQMTNHFYLRQGFS